MGQRVRVSGTTTASPEQVWALLGDVTTWPDWTPFTKAHYAQEGDPAPHGVGAVRRLALGPSWSTERVLGYEPPHRFVYGYEGPLPLRGYRGEVDVVPEGRGSRVTWTGTFTNGPLAGGPLLALVMRLVLGDVVRRLGRAAARA